ncbi:LysR family transcriptional regulator [Pseudocolwellia sp. AS88]|uniref:LysR family transcriptional regulator n=1 Tax=Pseudocolwellia sp. AS88 TaxID=3063958 RepID=UPI0026F0A06F|nr:LysR family transcriptional regulator [Pseudocolwellia sp. AS88]MDO7084246.1 LysR family transcriptional regulator [Pseudocolwellia sp. AS88]
MNSKQLQYFLTTADQGSITAAARELDVAQPAISLQLANLEHELKTKLFDRDFRGVTLNAAGKLFEQHARIILAQIFNAKAELMQGEMDCKGKVVVGVSQAACNVLSAVLLTELEHRHPGIDLSFRIGPSHIVDKWLADKEVDLAVRYHQDGTEKGILLLREALSLYISKQPKNPTFSELAMYASIPFEELQHYEIFMPDEKDALSTLLHEQAKKVGITLKSKKAFGQLMTTLHYVTQGLGLIIVPSSATFHLELSQQLRKIEIIQPNIWRDVYLHFSEKSNHTPAVLAVYELIRETAATAHANNSWQGELIDTQYVRQPEIAIEAMVEG